MGEYSFRLSLRIFHPSADPDWIETALGMLAHRKWKVGEPRYNRHGYRLEPDRETYCSFSIANGYGEPDESLVDELRLSLKELARHQDVLREFIATGGKIQYFVGWFIKGNSGEDFDPSLLGEMARLGIGLSFDIYAADD